MSNDFSLGYTKKLFPSLRMTWAAEGLRSPLSEARFVFSVSALQSFSQCEASSLLSSADLYSFVAHEANLFSILPRNESQSQRVLSSSFPPCQILRPATEVLHSNATGEELALSQAKLKNEPAHRVLKHEQVCQPQQGTALHGDIRLSTYKVMGPPPHNTLIVKANVICLFFFPLHCLPIKYTRRETSFHHGTRANNKRSEAAVFRRVYGKATHVDSIACCGCGRVHHQSGCCACKRCCFYFQA